MMDGTQGAAANLRARVVTLATAAARLKAQAPRAAPFALVYFADPRRGPTEIVVRAAPAGTAVVWRAYDAPRPTATARRIGALCRSRGLTFLTAGPPSLALAVGADGAHLPARLVRRLTARPRGLLLTCSAHNAAEVRAANRLGVDAAFLSPVFATRTHPQAAPLGVAGFAALASLLAAPALALGGVDARAAPRLAGTGAAGFGAIDAFWRAPSVNG